MDKEEGASENVLMCLPIRWLNMGLQWTVTLINYTWTYHVHLQLQQQKLWLIFTRSCAFNKCIQTFINRLFNLPWCHHWYIYQLCFSITTFLFLSISIFVIYYCCLSVGFFNYILLLLSLLFVIVSAEELYLSI